MVKCNMLRDRWFIKYVNEGFPVDVARHRANVVVDRGLENWGIFHRTAVWGRQAGQRQLAASFQNQAAAVRRWLVKSC